MILTACSRTVVLHPLTDQDIKMEGNWVCMSPDYVKNVMKARLGK